MKMPREMMFGRKKDWPKLKVGSTVYCQAAAPGAGHCVYLITKIDDRGHLYAEVIEDTIRILEPEECV